MSHEEEDDFSIDDAKGVQSSGSSRGVRGDNGRSDSIARNEADGPVLEDTGEQHLDLDTSGGSESVLSLAEEHSGPLPHPEILRRYDEIVPGSAARIIGVYVNEASTRSEILTRLSKAEAGAVSIGSLAAAILAIGGLVAAVVLVSTGNPWAGLITGLVTAGPAGLAKVVSAAKGGQPEER